jgi:capsular polysaccharide biosynthesis protein
VTDRDQRIIFSLNGDGGEPERFGGYDDFAGTESRSVDFTPSLASLGFIKAAVRRSVRFWGVIAILGLLLGVGTFKARPREFQASASVLLTPGPYDNYQTAAANNQAIAVTPAVAELAVRELGLQQNANSFLSSYAATSVTDQLLLVTASASSADQAVLRANAVASAFLKFRAENMQTEQNLVVESLQQQISQAKQQVSSINAQIGQAASAVQLDRLRTEQTNAENTLGGLEQAVIGNQTGNQPAVTAAIKGSKILNVAALPHSRLKPLITYGAIGLILGLAAGLGIVIIRALVSDRLRRRDDIAYALDAPVRLSIGTLRARRWLPSLPGRAASRDLDMRRFILRLQNAVPKRSQGPAGLAIVAVDNGPVVARAVAALAASYAAQGNRVLTADISMGTYMARLLGVKGPGAHAVSHNGANFTIVVPDRYDAAPVGPLRAVTSPTGLAQAGDALIDLYASADLLLTLVTLDPALGGDHLATWAPNAVVVVSAGQSSAERIHSVGEMIRLAGTRLDSVVLIGADHSDKSLGLAHASDEQVAMGVLGR